VHDQVGVKHSPWLCATCPSHASTIMILILTQLLLIFQHGGSAPSGYVDFKFISLPLAIVRIDCTIVRVIEPQRLLVVLRNRIFKERI